MTSFINKFPSEETFLAWLRKRILDGDITINSDGSYSIGTSSVRLKDIFVKGEARIPKLGEDSIVDGKAFDKTTVSTIATAANVTYTAGQIIGGLIIRDPNGAARSDVTPTAALIVSGIQKAIIGTSFEFTIKNNDAGAAETITVTAGVGVTLSGTMTITTGNSKRFLAVLTNVTAATEAVTIYSLGTVVH